MLPGNQVSTSNFFQVVGVVWEYLHPSTQQAIRQSSSTGRTLNDSRTTDLVVRLGHGKPDMIDADRECHGAEGLRSSEEAGGDEPLTPSELRAMVAAIVQRGARLSKLHLRCFKRPKRWHLPVREREEQLLAVLAAAPRGCPVSALTLSGGVPLSDRLATMIDTSLPNLKDLSICPYWYAHDFTDEDPNWGPAAQYFYGAMQLLSLCGPRLRELRLTHGVQWPALAFQALQKCTGLTTLALEAGRHHEGPFVGSFAHEDGIISSILQLTQLRALYLTIPVDPDEWTPDNFANYATSLARLSALAALTELELDLSPCYQMGGDSLHMMLEGEDDHELWAQVREVHRTSLLSALRAMPQLQRLHCPTLWLRPSEAATLTALTRLQLGGLLPPLPGESSSSSNLLPPRLADLCLDLAVSPRALASLQIPSTLTLLRACRLRFGMSDVNQETCQLLPETVAAVGPAVRLIKAFQPNGSLGRSWLLTADGAARPLLPRAGVPGGHAEWLRQLGALDGVDLALRGFALQVEDVCCLAQTLGKVQSLSISQSQFPVAALSGLLGLRALEKLDVDLSLAIGLTRSSLEKALTVLCSEATALRRVTCTRCPLSNCQEIQAAILERLRSKGKDGIQLIIQRPW